MRKWLLLAAAVLVVLGVAAVVLLRLREPPEIRGSSTVEFVPVEPPPEKPKPPETLPEKPSGPGIVWPTYGYDNKRLRSAAGIELRPPFRKVWTFGARSIVEFPPVVAYGRLFFANNDGVLFAVNARTGKRAWRYVSGRGQAASPAVDGHTVYHTFLYRHGQRERAPDGEVIAFATGLGKIRWRNKMIGPSESSPLVHRGYVYVGDWSGRVYCFVAKTGKRVWTFRAGGEVKSAVAASAGRLFVGSYDHHLYALDARTGKQIWRASVQDRLGTLGRFYSTPAVAYGRVYVGATDGRVYSYGSTSGKLRWSHRTDGYVYGSPAVWRKRILIGSYDGRFYALDAATGDVRWTFEANGPISGSATVIDGVVYFSTLKERTYALDAATGRLLWTFPDGQYSPVVADPERLYLVGKARVYGLVTRAQRGRRRGSSQATSPAG